MGIYKTVGKEEVLVKHEVFDKKIEIEETDITFDSIYDKPFIPQDYIEDIKKADILIIPEENFREEGCTFPRDYERVFRVSSRANS